MSIYKLIFILFQNKQASFKKTSYLFNISYFTYKNVKMKIKIIIY